MLNDGSQRRGGVGAQPLRGDALEEVPLPELTPALTASLGSIWMTLAPKPSIVRRTAAAEPRPISTIAITAAMPMMMPSAVSAERITLHRKARNAVRTV